MSNPDHAIKREPHTHLQKLRGKDDNGRRAIAHLLILQVASVHQHTGCRVGHLQLLQDGGTIVGDSDISNIVHLQQHE